MGDLGTESVKQVKERSRAVLLVYKHINSCEGEILQEIQAMKLTLVILRTLKPREAHYNKHITEGLLPSVKIKLLIPERTDFQRT